MDNEVIKMRCRFCGTELSEDDLYCPNCGIKVEKGNYDENHFGTSKKHDKNKIVWIILICIILVLGGSRYFFNKKENPSFNEVMLNPSTNNERYDYKKLEGTYIQGDNITELKSNLMSGGYICHDQQYVYIVDNDGNISRFDDQMISSDVLYEGNCSFMQLVNNTLYFVDQSKNNNIYKLDLSTNESRMIADVNAYYLYVDGDQLYFQNDPDNESLYSLDLNDFHLEKLNDEICYDIQTEGDLIFYTTADSIKTFNKNTKEMNTILNQAAYDLIVAGDNLYYISMQDYYIYSYEWTNENASPKRLNKEITKSFVVNDDSIYYLNNYSEVISMNLDGLNNQMINDEVVGELIHIQGDYLFIPDCQYSDGDEWYRMDLNGENGEYVFGVPIGSYF